MKTYTATFRTDAEFATRDFKAATPEQALKKARRFYDDDPLDLMFESYDGGMPVNEIAINDADDDEVAVWLDEDLRLRLAARDLLDALEAMIDRDDAESVFATPVLDQARAALASSVLPTVSSCRDVEPEDAHFWSVYGHHVTGGLECFEDFPTEAEAEAFAARLRRTYPHLASEARP
jgi:hypothetical protein